MARGGKRPGAGRKPKQRSPTPDEIREAADRAEGHDSEQDEPRGRGRPTPYQPIFARQAGRLLVDGATDADLAGFFEVSIRTIYRWKHDHDDFRQALKRAKDVADDVVENSLFRRATGYSHDAVKILQYEGQPVVVPYIEHYPPDTAAAIIWLKNRRPDRWRDKPVEDTSAADAMSAARKVQAALKEIDMASGADASSPP